MEKLEAGRQAGSQASQAGEQAGPAVVVGRALIGTPDLVERWQGGRPENEPRPEFSYAPGRAFRLGTPKRHSVRTRGD